MDDTLVLRLLTASVHAAYIGSLQGTNFSTKRFEWFKAISPGNLVMETSTAYIRGEYDFYRFGYLISADYEFCPLSEKWEAIKKRRNGRPREKELVHRIKLLASGREYMWTNANFIRVPENILNIKI